MARVGRRSRTARRRDLRQSRRGGSPTGNVCRRKMRIRHAVETRDRGLPWLSVTLALHVRLAWWVRQGLCLSHALCMQHLLLLLLQSRSPCSKGSWYSLLLRDVDLTPYLGYTLARRKTIAPGPRGTVGRLLRQHLWLLLHKFSTGKRVEEDGI